jgi:hypothetical protein
MGINRLEGQIEVGAQGSQFIGAERMLPVGFVLLLESGVIDVRAGERRDVGAFFVKSEMASVKPKSVRELATKKNVKPS